MSECEWERKGENEREEKVNGFVTGGRERERERERQREG